MCLKNLQSLLWIIYRDHLIKGFNFVIKKVDKKINKSKKSEKNIYVDKIRRNIEYVK